MRRTSFIGRLGLLAWVIPILQACPQNCNCPMGQQLHVICDGAGLKKFPKVSDQTQLLSMQRNSFPVLAPNSFKEMKGVVSLHLQHNQIKEIASGAFRGLNKLVYLYISNNEISTVRSGAFDDLSLLTYLYMDHNKMAELPKGIFSPLINLFVLQLSNNKIRELKPGTFAGAKDLRWLYLANNEINSMLPGSLDEVENLAIFHIEGNQLSTYPVAAMSKLRVVEDLKISYNPLKALPDFAFQSFGRYMESLFMDNMGLEKISEKAFIGVTTLKSAHIENNRLNNLPKNFPFGTLENLTLSNNPWHCSCQLTPLRRWLDSGRARSEAACATPAQYKGQQVRDTAAFRTCKTPTKKLRKDLE